MVAVKFPFDYGQNVIPYFISLYLTNDITSSFLHQLPDLIIKGTSHILEIEKLRHNVNHDQVCGIFANTGSQFYVIKGLKNLELISY